MADSKEYKNYKCPSVKVGGIPVLDQVFSWHLTSGVQPFQTGLLVTNYHANQMKNLNPLTTLECKFYGGTSAKATEVSFKIDKVSILKFKVIDPFHQMVLLADSRWLWRGKKLYGAYNKTRVMNQVKLERTDTQNKRDPHVLREQFDRFSQGRYLGWSVKAAKTAAAEKENGKPWSIKEILEDQLKKLEIPFDQKIGGADGSYIKENIVLDGVDIYQGINRLMRSSRLNMGIKRNGEVYIYSIDFFDDTKISAIKAFQNAAKTRPGLIYKQDQKRVRPKSISVRFEKKIETWVVGCRPNASETYELEPKDGVYSQEDILERRAIPCINVIQIPFPVTVKGISYNIGEWVPMHKYLEAVGITDIELRQYWFGSSLEHIYSQRISGLQAGEGSTPEEQQAIARRICASIRQHYRKTWQIERYYLDRIKVWEPRLTSVVNNYDRYTPPSPLYCDMCIVPKQRYSTLAKKTALFSRHSYNWKVEEQDKFREKPTVGSISVVSQPLGLFQIVMPPMVNDVIKEIYPFTLTPTPYPSASNSAAHLELCNVDSTFTMETVVSIIWDIDRYGYYNSERKYFILHTDYKEDGGTGPNIDYLSRAEFARYIRPGTLTSHLLPTNYGLLEAIAQSEGARLMNQYKDREVGMITISGLIDIDLTGNLSQVVYNFSHESGLETIIDMREIPDAPSLEQTLPQEALDFLWRNIARGDNSNELKGGA